MYSHSHKKLHTYKVLHKIYKNDFKHNAQYYNNIHYIIIYYYKQNDKEFY